MVDKPVIRVPANLPTPAFDASGLMSDGFINFVSRLGTGSDKASHGTYRYYQAMFSQLEVEAAYRTSWFRKIVDIPPFDETREWRNWAGADEEQITPIFEEERRIGLRQKVKEARTLARKDGGAVIVIGTADGGSLEGELIPDTVSQGGLKYIAVLNRYEISAGEKEIDMRSPWFGGPKYYTLANGQNTKVHPSRVIRFLGNPIRQANYWDGWGDSIWIELRDAVTRADQVAAGTAALIEEAKLDILKVAGLMANITTTEGENNLVRRFGTVNTLKSIINALVIDKEDEYEQKTQTFDGLPDVQDRMLMIMSGQADIPATRLLGRSPQGMNATGESDLKNYYDRIRAYQTVELSPSLFILDEVMIRSALGTRDKKIYYEWAPLYSPTEKEAADVEKVFADAANVYANAGLIPDTALTKIVQNSITERGQWSGAEKAFAEAEAEGDEPGLLAEPTEAELAEEAAMVAEAGYRAANPAETVKPGKRLAAKDSAPRTLYVRRNLLNAAELIKWAKAQGFTSTMPADELHVTIAYSPTPIDWMKVPATWSFGSEAGDLIVPPGGARIVEKLGKSAIVLSFKSNELEWRNMAIRDAGAAWGYPEYQPHITITFNPDAAPPLDEIVPFRGALKFGPEIFEEVHLDWAKGMSEVTT